MIIEVLQFIPHDQDSPEANGADWFKFPADFFTFGNTKNLTIKDRDIQLILVNLAGSRNRGTISVSPEYLAKFSKTSAVEVQASLNSLVSGGIIVIRDEYLTSARGEA